MDKRNSNNINYILGREKATKTRLERHNNGWKALAAAIVEQAIKDYRARSTSYIELTRIQKFLSSEWCQDFLNIDGKYLLRKLNEYRRSKGYVVVYLNNSGGYTRSCSASGSGAVGHARSQKG